MLYHEDAVHVVCFTKLDKEAWYAVMLFDIVTGGRVCIGSRVGLPVICSKVCLSNAR